MITTARSAKTRIRFLALLVIGLAAPLAFNTKSGLAANNAMCGEAGAHCCTQQRSSCCYDPNKPCTADAYDNGTVECPAT